MIVRGALPTRGRPVRRAAVGGVAVLLTACSALNSDYDPESSATTGQSTTGEPQPPSASASMSQTATTAAGSQTDGKTSGTTVSDDTDTSFPDNTTAGATTTDAADGSTGRDARECFLEEVLLNEDAFLVADGGDVAFANFGVTTEHPLYQTSSSAAVLLLRIPEIDDLTGVETVQLTVTLRAGNAVAGVLHASVMNTATTCDWAEGTQNGSGAADGVTWAICSLLGGTTWPGEGPLDAVAMSLGEQDLANLGPQDRAGRVRAEFVRDVSGMSALPERSVLLYTEQLDGGPLDAFTSEAPDEAARPKLWFERCL